MAWTRLLTLELGHTIASASAVLAAFMGGLALGAFAAGRWTRRLTPRAAFRAYAAVEILIAALALAVPLEIAAIHPLLALAYGDGPGGPAFQLLRLGAAIGAVGFPAALMGATYPLIVHAARADRHAGSLYAFNTAGAALGAIATGFVLLPAFGLFRTTLLGVGGNMVVAAIAWHWTRAAEETPAVPGRSAASPSRQARTAGVPSPTAPRDRTLALAVTAAAGFLSLSLELAWTRTLAMVVGPTTYAFSGTISCFILGIAIGSAGAAAWLRRPQAARRPELWLALSLALACLSTAWALGRIDEMVLAMARRSLDPGIGYLRLTATGFADAALLVIPAAIGFGAAFPLALATAGAASSTDAARVYVANTVGAIAGSLLGAAVAIPVLGVRGTFVAGAAIAGTVALATAFRRPPRLSAARLAAAGAAALGVVLAVSSGWNAALLSSGAYKYATYLGNEDLEVRLAAGTLRYYREGASGTVAVRDLAGVRTLSIDGKVDASNGGDMLTQRLLAHVPLLLHPAAERVAIIGLGSGVTLGSALTHPIERADVIEISAEVVEAASWFALENRQALSDPRVRLIVGDARTHMRLAPLRYDVVISEPSNPWMAGVAALFTREFFGSLKARLAPGGVVCQWAHTYDIRATDLKSIVRTFASVFPVVRVWLVGDGDLLLVGSERALPSELIETPLSAAARADLAGVGVTGPDLLGHLVLGDRPFATAWAGEGVLQSDDRMALEFSAPVATVGATREDNAASLLAFARRASADAVTLRGLGLMALHGQAPARAWDAFSAAVDGLPEDRIVLNGLVRAAAMAPSPDRLNAAEARLRALISSRPEAIAARLELAQLLASRGDFDEANVVVRAAERGAPGDADVQEQMAGIAADAEDASALASAVERLRTLRPGGARTTYFEGVLRMLTGRAPEAVALAQAAVATDSKHAPSWNLLGSASGAAGRPNDEIRHAFVRAIEADPSDPTGYVNLGTLELSSGNPGAAANWFAQAMTVSSDHQGARAGLAAARSALR